MGDMLSGASTNPTTFKQNQTNFILKSGILSIFKNCVFICIKNIQF